MRVLALLSITMMSACTTASPTATVPVVQPDASAFACNADAAQYAVGQKSSASLADELLKKTGSQTLRWMPPRSMATMDFRTDRLNIAYDDAMVITQISCG